MIKRFFKELGFLILLNFTIYLIYSSAFGDSFHATVPGEKEFQVFDVKAIGSFLFFYPVLITTSFLVYFIRTIAANYRNKILNNFTFILNVLAVGFPFLAWYYGAGLEFLIEKKAPHYDSFTVPIKILQYSIFPIFVLLFYNAHYIPLAQEPQENYDPIDNNEIQELTTNIH